MITSKQRAYLRKLGHGVDPIFQIGKSGVTPEITNAIADALKAREILKLNVLKNCPYEPKDIAQVISERTRSEIVQIIGRKITLFRQNREDSKIILP